MEKSGRHKLIVTLCVVAALIIIVGVIFYDAVQQENTYETAAVVMGSVLSVELYGSDGEETAEQILVGAYEAEECYISRYIETSEIYLLNENGEGELSDFTSEIMAKALEISANSQGAFDITIGNLSSLWDFDNEKNTIPSDDEIQEALATCGYEQITHSGNTYTLAANQTVDLGAVGKGVICDIAADILDVGEMQGAVISAGGTILVYGENPGKDYWSVGIKGPAKDNDDYYSTLTLTETSYISTSGNYEKSFTQDGTVYHHILSPDTGMPVQTGLLSVTVIANSGLVSDALSTACFVLGYEDSAELLDIYNASAVFVTEDKTVLTYGNIDDSVKITDNDYTYG